MGIVMGRIVRVNPVVISVDCTVLESGKLLRRFWRDRTINCVIGRIPS